MKYIVVIFIIGLLAAGVVVGLYTKKTMVRNNEVAPSPSTVVEKQFVPYSANFEIYTNDTRRIFTDERYHNLNEDFFITRESPNQVQVQKAQTTWKDFFATLPMSLTKDCLVTGTKQTFCSNENGQLKFYLNDVENPNALDEVIQKDDNLVVRYE